MGFLRNLVSLAANEAADRIVQRISNGNTREWREPQVKQSATRRHPAARPINIDGTDETTVYTYVGNIFSKIKKGE